MKLPDLSQLVLALRCAAPTADHPLNHHEREEWLIRRAFIAGAAFGLDLPLGAAAAALAPTEQPDEH